MINHLFYETDVQKHIPCDQLSKWVLHRVDDVFCMWSQTFTAVCLVLICVFISFYNGLGDVNVDVIKKILGTNKQVKSMHLWCEEFSNFTSNKLLSPPPPPPPPPAGEHHRLVQTTQEHGSADDLQRKGHPREAEERPVQPSHHLPAANTQQCSTSGLNPQDGVRRLHLTQQVAIFFFYLTMQNNHALTTSWINCTDPESVNDLSIPLLTNLETSKKEN